MRECRVGDAIPNISHPYQTFSLLVPSLTREMSFKTASLAVVLMHLVIIFAAVVWAESKSKASDFEQVS